MPAAHKKDQVQGKNLEAWNKTLWLCILVRKFSADEIKEATGNFSQLSILGKGGFGIVYQGYLKGTKVAIKQFTEVWFNKRFFDLDEHSSNVYLECCCQILQDRRCNCTIQIYSGWPTKL